MFSLAGGEQQLCCLRTASPQGIAALAAQGGVATLTERSDATFSVMQLFLLTENEAPQDALLSTESIEVRPLVPKGVCSGLISRQTAISHFSKYFPSPI